MLDEEIVGVLLSWFKGHGRAFPFRWQKDPYKILVAGVLLRQTQAIQVASVYPELLEAYPSISSLAAADEAALRTMLKPLGMTSRAKTLIETARKIRDEYNGVVPNSYIDLVKLGGVGDYIASCILALGYGRSLPMVDINVARVIGRLFGENEDIHATYAKLCPIGVDEPFHYAILDLAQIVCRHSKPRCNICPLRDICKCGILIKN